MHVVFEELKWWGFLLIRQKTFADNCNRSMVELLPLELPEDMHTVKELLHEFFDKTGSEVAHQIIQSWPNSARLFVKVIGIIFLF